MDEASLILRSTERLGEAEARFIEAANRTGQYHLQALEEIAFQYGGETYAGNIVDIAVAGEAVLPNNEAFRTLRSADDILPMLVYDRAKVIATDVRRQELRGLFKDRMRIFFTGSFGNLRRHKD